MHFIEITKEQLENLGASLDILGKIKDLDGHSLFVVGKMDSKYFDNMIDQYIEEYDFDVDADNKEEVKAAKAATKAKAIALVLPVSGDTVHYLTTTGLRLDTENVYIDIEKKGIKDCDLDLSSIGKMKFENLKDVVLMEDTMYVPEYLGGNTKTGSVEEPKTADTGSRIVRILDANGNDWDENDVESTVKMIEKVEEADPSHMFVSYAEGELSKWFIEVKNGPEAAYNYLAMKMEDQDKDAIINSSVVLSKDEAIEFFNGVLETMS